MTMDHQHGQSHRQEREKKKEEHSHPTRGKYFSSRHLTWTLVVAVILMGVAVMVWTFLLPRLRGPD
jgi:fucose permease